MNVRRSLPLALLAAATAVLTTACSSTGAAAGAATGGASASAGQTAGAVPVSSKTSKTSGSQDVRPSQPATPPQAAPTAKAPGGSAGSGGNATSDAYAWKHPCDSGQVTVAVQYQHTIGDTRRVIVATNHGKAACGLSYYPAVSVADSASIGATSGTAKFVTPKVPGGLGGAPYASIHAGQSLYAVIDLDPGHTTSGAVRSFDELDVKSADFMPDAATTNHPLKNEPAGSGNPYVKGPILSLYQPSLADAVAQVSDLGDFA
ncbi:DUF4232 domain-containing protein [Streptacidiphilus cavernicola]|uniref:DUF4232 domain-containing protein n=1 Tax=Streptacidiphilus cavernicola TaxID=3342716 RepID=A0ABV6W2P6_9ACTN